MIEELIYFGGPFVAAVLLALSLPLLAITQYRVAAWLAPDLRVVALLVIVATGAMVTVMLTPRLLNEKLFKPEFVYATDYASGFLTSRMLSVVLVGAALVEIARGLLSARRRLWDDPALPVLAGLLLFYLGTPLFQLVGSDHPGFRPRNLYVPLVLAAVCLLQIQRIDRIVWAAKCCIFACTAGSLLAAVVTPDFAVARPAPGLIPGVDFRLFGLTGHANALGPIALVGLMLELHTPSRRRPLRWLSLACAAAALVLAQSKTAWGAALVVALVTWLPLRVLPSRQPQLQAGSFARAALTLIACLLVLAAVAVGLSQFDLSRFFDRNASLLTLTGRFEIWSITLDEWRKNLLFGYGPGLWSPEYMLSHNMRHVGQAHNQFVQTLGDSGLLGLATLLACLATLFSASVRCFRASRGLLMGLFMLLLLRCVTEASMRADGLLTWTLFTNVLLVVLSCHFLRSAAQPKPDTSDTAQPSAPPRVAPTWRQA